MAYEVLTANVNYLIDEGYDFVGYDSQLADVFSAAHVVFGILSGGKELFPSYEGDNSSRYSCYKHYILAAEDEAAITKRINALPAGFASMAPLLKAMCDLDPSTRVTMAEAFDFVTGELESR